MDNGNLKLANLLIGSALCQINCEEDDMTDDFINGMIDTKISDLPSFFHDRMAEMVEMLPEEEQGMTLKELVDFYKTEMKK